LTKSSQSFTQPSHNEKYTYAGSRPHNDDYGSPNPKWRQYPPPGPMNDPG
jgi:hypothetical protein